jgi:hypothetical protein
MPIIPVLSSTGGLMLLSVGGAKLCVLKCPSLETAILGSFCMFG